MHLFPECIVAIINNCDIRFFCFFPTFYVFYIRKHISSQIVKTSKKKKINKFTFTNGSIIANSPISQSFGGCSVSQKYGRQLCWLGKVARMEMSRLPRQMLSAWVKNKRPVGRPRLTYGATVNKALKYFNLIEKHNGLPWPTLCVQQTRRFALIAFTVRFKRFDNPQKLIHLTYRTVP